MIEKWKDLSGIGKIITSAVLLQAVGAWVALLMLLNTDRIRAIEHTDLTTTTHKTLHLNDVERSAIDNMIKHGYTFSKKEKAWVMTALSLLLEKQGIEIKLPE